MRLDAKRREYDIVVVGEEPHLAYNRVGLTSFFQHRNVENLYLNPKEWVCQNSKERIEALDTALTKASHSTRTVQKALSTII